MSQRTNRRGFLHASALTGVGCLMVGGVRKRVGAGASPAAAPVTHRSPNGRIAMASIGLGGKGSSDSSDAGNFGDMVAICDVDEKVLNNAGEKRFPKAKRYTDFRKMLDEMGGGIDAVTVSTPDHTHAAAALMAMRMGKHCFCQKPLTHTIYEARLMAQVAKQSNVATQMGNQGTSLDSLRKAAAIVKSGTLGTIKDVYIWTDRPSWPQGGHRPKSVRCPAHLDWNLWLGPAAPRPFANGYHPFSWRGWWDFGTGALGDMACHTVNMAYMALNLRDPIAVQAETSGHNGDSYPKWSVIHFDFPAINGRPAMRLHWYDGGKRPGKEIMGEMDTIFKNEIAEARSKSVDFFGGGCIVVGDKQTFYSPGYYSECRMALGGNAPLPEVHYPKSPGHFEEWVRAIQGGEPAMSNFADYSGGLTETILLGNLAVWTAATGKGPRVEWDAKNLRSTNIAGLETIVKPFYRPGYTLDV